MKYINQFRGQDLNEHYRIHLAVRRLSMEAA